MQTFQPTVKGASRLRAPESCFTSTSPPVEEVSTDEMQRRYTQMFEMK